ncbi:MAG: PqqD family protein [Planctomycetota bacterium]
MTKRRPAANTVTLERLLAAVPTANRAVRAEQRGEALVLFVPLRERWWMRGPASWWLPFRKERGIALDRLGQEVWAACDGVRNVEAVVAEFSRRHRLGFHEARLKVMAFLRLLAERKLLVLIGPSAAPEPTEAPTGAGGEP